MEYSGAGVFFHDETHFLGGYQPKIGCISGIGGKREEDDSKHTALREMLEELLGYTNPYIIQALEGIQEERCIRNGGYIIYVFSLYELCYMLHIISTFSIQSPFYETHPLTMDQLIYLRNDTPKEITRLYLLPLTRTEGLSPELIKDLTNLIHNEW
jgi:hypothetical protein